MMKIDKKTCAGAIWVSGISYALLPECRCGVVVKGPLKDEGGVLEMAHLKRDCIA